jgi:hypothetical protein
MTDKEAMKLALEALEQTLETLDNENSKPGGAIADTIWHSEHETLFDYLTSTIDVFKERLAQPPQRKPLTAEVITRIGMTHQGLHQVARAIEAAHGIKEDT